MLTDQNCQMILTFQFLLNIYLLDEQQPNWRFGGFYLPPMPGLWERNPQLSHITLQPEGGGENLHPVYIITSSCPETGPTTQASRPWFRGHRKNSLQPDYIEAVPWVLPSRENLAMNAVKPNEGPGFMDPKTLSCRCKATPGFPLLHPSAPLISPLMRDPWWLCNVLPVTTDGCVTCPNWSLISTPGDRVLPPVCCTFHPHTTHITQFPPSKAHISFLFLFANNLLSQCR